VLRIRNLRGKYFGPINLEVGGGECVALQGVSGAGKSVFLRAIVDLDPNTGQVSWNDRERGGMPAPIWRRVVAFVPAESGWWADGVASHFEDPTDAVALLSAVGLPIDAVQWDVARLSTGERHRLALVRAILQKPEVLLLDEPTASLDPEATELVENLLEQQLAAGVAIILVTHDPAQAQRLASRTVVMEKGTLPEVVVEGT